MRDIDEDIEHEEPDEPIEDETIEKEIKKELSAENGKSKSKKKPAAAQNSNNNGTSTGNGTGSELINKNFCAICEQVDPAIDVKCSKYCKRCVHLKCIDVD